MQSAAKHLARVVLTAAIVRVRCFAALSMTDALLQQLINPGHALAAADAGRYQAEFLAALAQLVE